MLLATKEIHQRVADLGGVLGFVATNEVSDSLLRLRLDESYRPRIDLLWSIALDHQKRQAIAWALDRKLGDVTHLPVTFDQSTRRDLVRGTSLWFAHRTIR